MRNIEYYYGDDVKERLLSLIPTPEIRDYLIGPDKGPKDFLQQAFEGACQRPLFTYKYDNFALENAHFMTWLGCVGLRDYYENKVIESLYYCHEIAHWGTMLYDPEISFSKWHQKMSLNEYHAALASEAFIYYQIPGLREKSFPFEIWWDEYAHVQNAFFTDTWTQLFEARRRAIRNPDPSNFQEMQIALYARQNFEWSLTWQYMWQRVESEMERYLKLYGTDQKGACESHMDWIQEHLADIPVDDAYPEGERARVMFPNEAVVFRDILQETKKKGGNRILDRQSTPDATLFHMKKFKESQEEE